MKTPSGKPVISSRALGSVRDNIIHTIASEEIPILVDAYRPESKGSPLGPPPKAGSIIHRQSPRQKERDLAELKGVDQVSKIMGLVNQTLECRLASEQMAREEQSQLEILRGQIRHLETFFRNFQDVAANKRRIIEDTAL